MFLWRWPALKSLESKTLHRAWRFMCSGVSWGGVGTEAYSRPSSFPSSDTFLETMKS